MEFNTVDQRCHPEKVSDDSLLGVAEEHVSVEKLPLARLSTREWLEKYELMKLLPLFAKECITVDKCICLQSEGQLVEWFAELKLGIMDRLKLKRGITDMAEARAKLCGQKLRGMEVTSPKPYAATPQMTFGVPIEGGHSPVVSIDAADDVEGHRDAVSFRLVPVIASGKAYLSPHRGADEISRSPLDGCKKTVGRVVYRSRDEMVAELSGASRSKKKKKRSRKPQVRDHSMDSLRASSESLDTAARLSAYRPFTAPSKFEQVERVVDKANECEPHKGHKRVVGGRVMYRSRDQMVAELAVDSRSKKKKRSRKSQVADRSVKSFEMEKAVTVLQTLAKATVIHSKSGPIPFTIQNAFNAESDKICEFSLEHGAYVELTFNRTILRLSRIDYINGAAEMGVERVWIQVLSDSSAAVELLLEKRSSSECHFGECTIQRKLLRSPLKNAKKLRIDFITNHGADDGQCSLAYVAFYGTMEAAPKQMWRKKAKTLESVESAASAALNRDAASYL